MPAASCRIMPARSISRCDTISASFGFSLRMGRKNRDNRMGTLKESVEHGRPAVKPDRVGKHKGGRPSKPRERRLKTAQDSPRQPMTGFWALPPHGARDCGANASKFSFSRKAYVQFLMSGDIQLIIQRNLLEVGHQRLDP